ncbi:MAG: prepilin peptidase [Planctomycetota bacterium]|nr:MAG: prepilin peptidase [Planctomycetota bacterium]
MQGSIVVTIDWIWLVFIFAFGCCVGSFLNVVIYRLPRDQSLVSPASACPACAKPIAFYDNIPLVSWLLLGRKCRYCKAPISPRYFVIEMLTGVVFTGLFILYFRTDLRTGVPPFLRGGWFIYLLHIIMLAAFIAASAIDLKLWVIPVSICWFVTAVGLIASAVGVYIIEPNVIRNYGLLPSASAATASLAAGAVIGLAISMTLVTTGLIKRSYESDREDLAHDLQESKKPQYNDRREIYKEIAFLLAIIICSLSVFLICREIAPICKWWADFSQRPVIAGLLGSLWGYFVGCGLVWATRIFGTIGFGREAMGLGDVHLMGAAGAVIGCGPVVVAFFIAPFFGLAWAGFQLFFKKIRQIPYGPFLSLGVLAVMILRERIFSRLVAIFYY